MNLLFYVQKVFLVVKLAEPQPCLYLYICVFVGYFIFTMCSSCFKQWNLILTHVTFATGFVL